MQVSQLPGHLPGNKIALPADLWSSNTVCVWENPGYQCQWVRESSVTSDMGSGEHSGTFDHGLDSFSFSGLHPECHTTANQRWNVPWLSDSSHAAVA